MRVAIVGSRNLMVDIAKYIPANTTEIVSGGARGVDTLAEHWADQNNIPKVIFKPDYKRHGRAAPIKRNVLIVEAADLVVAIWDGESRGTKFTIDYAKQVGKPVQIVLIERHKRREKPCNPSKTER
ncbi:MAG: SLOG family protein [Candidatus Pelethousia sp.]|jgi:predicted Rossmann fold nucleotide-binding protein DprA/Smf involved in DNA uptake|nr:SLOG family protein [Candidatus Pelethousia sp.]